MGLIPILLAHHQNIIKMAENKPIFSRRISAGTRVYFIDARVDKKSQTYLSISEIPTKKCPEKKKRQRIFIHGENVDQFTEALAEIAEFVKNGIKK